MIKTSLLLLIVISGTLIVMGQYVSPAGNKGAGGGGGSTFTFVANSYYSEDSTSLSSFTIGSNTGHSGPALSATSGDILFMMVQNVASGNNGTYSCSPACTVHSVTTGTFGSGISWNVAGSTASTTETFSSSANTFSSGVALQYHYSGPGVAIDTHLEGSCSAGASCTSAAFTTTAASLVVFCVGQPDSGITFTAGNIGGSASTLRGVSDSANAGAGVAAGCEEKTFATAQTSITAAISSDSGTSFSYELVALK